MAIQFINKPHLEIKQKEIMIININADVTHQIIYMEGGELEVDQSEDDANHCKLSYLLYAH